MPSFYPRSACVLNAEERRTAYINGTLHLFQNTLVPNPTTPLADYTAAEADFDNYAALTLAAADWPTPGYSPLGGARLINCCSQFEFIAGGGPVVTNIIGGWYFLDTGGALRAAGTLDNAFSMAVNGDVLPVTMVFEFPTGV